jgi:hypothetical protein
MAESPASSAQRKKQMKLSTKGLENPASLRINDFGIQVGSERFECSRFEAAFISPRITELLLQDPTIDEYEIEVEVDNADGIDWECVRSLFSLSRNGLFEVNETNFEIVKQISKSLGNRELCETLKEFANEVDEMNSSNVVERFLLCEFLDICGYEEFDYLCSHLFEIDRNIFRKLKHSELKKIVQSNELRIFSEDWLLDLILELGTDYFDLLGCVHTEYLSQGGISRLLESISREQIDDNLWESLCRRLLLCCPSPQLPESRFQMRDFGIDSSQPLDGILSHLSLECGGNVHTHEIVSITASSNVRNSCHQVVDYNWTNYWYSKDESNSWIQIDFKARRISPTHYTIKSDGEGGHHLLKWSLNGSNDGTSWINLDRRDTNDLKGDYIVKSYACESIQSSSSSSSSSPFFQFIRLTQIGKNSSGCDYLMLANLELFGKVSEFQLV